MLPKESSLKKIVCLCLAISIATIGIAQTYTEYKTGPNTWGGAYVPPVWTKTYNLDIKKYSGNTVTVNNSSSNNPSTTNSSTGGATFVKKKKNDFGNWTLKETDYEEQAKQAHYEDKKARENAIALATKLNAAVSLYETGDFINAYNSLSRLYDGIGSTSVMKVGEYNDYSNVKYINYADHLWEKYLLYSYLTSVKTGRYKEAIATYKLLFITVDGYNIIRSRKGKDGYSEEELYRILDFNSINYPFLDTITKRKVLNAFSVGENFRGQLVFAELLAGLGRKGDAKLVLSEVLKYYLPQIENFDRYTAQIGINYFLLKDLDNAASFLEYYWNNSESYNARLGVLNELMGNDATDSWNEKNFREGFSYVENNYLFIDSLRIVNNLKPNPIDHRLWHKLYAVKSDGSKYIAHIRPQIEKDFEAFYKDTDNTGGEFAVDFYLMELLKKGDEKSIRIIMEKMTDYAQKKFDKRKLDVPNLLKENDDRNKSMPELYWKKYYTSLADPVVDALIVFFKRKFAKTGGGKYLREYAKPFINELSAFTEDELGSYTAIDLKECDMKPKYLKSRKYPKTVD